MTVASVRAVDIHALEYTLRNNNNNQQPTTNNQQSGCPGVRCVCTRGSLQQTDTHDWHACEFKAPREKVHRCDLHDRVSRAPLECRTVLVKKRRSFVSSLVASCLPAFARCFAETEEFSSWKCKRPWSWCETNNDMFSDRWRLLLPLPRNDAREWPSEAQRWSGSRCWAPSSS